MSESGDKPPELPVPIPKSYDRERVEQNFWPKFKRLAGQVPGIADLLALYYYMNSDVAPAKHKVSVIATLAYFIMPMDLIPDFLGVLGYTDDVALAVGLIKFIGADVMKPFRLYSRRWLAGEIDTEDRHARTDSPAPPSAVIDLKK